MLRRTAFAAGLILTVGVMGCSSTPASGDGGTPTIDSGTLTIDGGTPTLDSGKPTGDGGPGNDSGPTNAAVGTWLNGPVVATGTAKQETTKAYVFAADGTFTYSRLSDYPEDTGAQLEGCQFIRQVTGKYTVSGMSVTITPSGGTSLVRACTDTSLDKPNQPLPSDDSDLVSRTGQIAGNKLTVSDTEYTRQ